ncbi:MAG: hypothetical protein LIO85_02885 [Rikenellaceae bacterium]|nr:hypothetical protein [Rikenellaceae bacterium]
MATDGVVRDTVVTVNGHLFDVREITRDEFYRLYGLHAPEPPRFRVIRGLSDKRQILRPEYEFVFEGDRVREIRRGGKQIYENIWFDDDFDEQYTHFYPDLGLILYTGGHDSGEALNLYTGKHEGYDPEKTVTSADGQFRLSSIMSAQQGDEFWIDVYRAGKGEYERLAHLYDFSPVLDRWDGFNDIQYMDQFGGERFWIGNSLYFRNPFNGERCFCITVEI